MLAASAHALKQGRSPCVVPNSYSLLTLVDEDNNLVADVGNDTLTESETQLAAAVETRTKRGLHFAPTIQEHIFNAQEPPCAGVDNSADEPRPLRVKQKMSALRSRTVHLNALAGASEAPAATAASVSPPRPAR